MDLIPFLFLWIECGVLAALALRMAYVPFERNVKMPWYVATIFVVGGLGLGILFYIISTLSLATLIDKGFW